MASKTILSALLVVSVLVASEATIRKHHQGNPIEAVGVISPLPYRVRRDAQDEPHSLQKRFLGLHAHRRHKVYLVHPAPPQVVVIRKHHRNYRPVSVHLGRRRHHSHGINVHFGLGR